MFYLIAFKCPQVDYFSPSILSAILRTGQGSAALVLSTMVKGEQSFLGRERAHPMMNAPLNMLMRWNPWGPHFGKDGRRPPHPSMAWRFCEAPDLNTLCVCRHCLFFVISCFFSSHSVGKDENLQLLIVSWHEPSTFLACYFFFFFWLHRTFL